MAGPVTLEYLLCDALISKMGERGDKEDFAECLYRIIRERDQALLAIALDRLKQNRH
jgi:hypothetical protein